MKAKRKPRPLRDIKELDIVTTVELNNPGEGKPLYHALYASQLYGTFFGVFGQFTLEPGTEKEDTRKVWSLHLRILNLQGVLNIGFSNSDPYYKVETRREKGKEIKVKVIRMGVRGASGIVDKTLDLKRSGLTVTKGKRTRILLERMAFPLAGFAPGGPNADPEEDLGTPNQADQFFDSEFHYRNGIDHHYQTYRNGRSDRRDKVSILWPAAKCVPAHIYLLYTRQ